MHFKTLVKLAFFLLVYSHSLHRSRVTFSSCVESDVSYLKERVKFIVFDNFHVGADGKSILDVIANELKVPADNVYYLDEDMARYNQDSLLLPLLFRHASESKRDFDWFFVLNSNTRFDHALLNDLLYRMNNEQAQFEKIQNIDNTINIKSPNNNYLGAQINDNTPSIVHHYDLDKSFKYPFVHSGYLIRKYAIESLQVSLNSRKSSKRYSSKIHTDVHYELSKLLRDELGVVLKDVPEFCITLSDTDPKYHKKNSQVPNKCITWSISHRISHACVSFSIPVYGGVGSERGGFDIIDPSRIVVAVKTTRENHHTRVKQIYELWANRSRHLNYDSVNSNPHCAEYASGVKQLMAKHRGRDINVEFLSDYGENVNSEIQVVDLGIENQTSGHCSKLHSILHYLFNKYSGSGSVDYYVIVDDDTLVVPFSLLNVLTYVDRHHSDGREHNSDLYMGLRYSLGSVTENWSIDYITGGGGIVINSKALHRLASCRECVCNSPNEPDDMALGRWFRYLNVKATNFFGFNQAEPNNYHPYYNHYSHIVSYHKIDSDVKGTSSKYGRALFKLLYTHVDSNDQSDVRDEL